MKNWQESRQVFEWLSTLRAEQRRAALATVVHVNGSAYRREGATMGIAEDGAEQVALAIVAELLAVCSKREPVSLRHRELPMHQDTEVRHVAAGG